MRIFLAGNTIFPQYVAPLILEADNATVLGWGRPVAERGGYDPIIREHKPFILESFFYADADTERLLPYYGDFLLDSGAFTFCQNDKSNIDWNTYADEYADFINRNRVEKFFELDIDSVIGYDNVLKLRKRLEAKTGKQCIPVWHIPRGKQEFISMCKEYGYVAIGGVAGKKISAKNYDLYVRSFPWFINIAHEYGAKIHGLGYTSLDGLKKYHFDSVDSTAWTTGNRFGYLYWFDGHTMKKKDVPSGHRLCNSRAAALHNYTEWIKYQKWAITHL